MTEDRGVIVRYVVGGILLFLAIALVWAGRTEYFGYLDGHPFAIFLAAFILGVAGAALWAQAVKRAGSDR